MQGLEGEVLQLPLERVDAEPVGERRVDLERLSRLLHLLLLAEVLDRAQVVEAVGELDQDHPDVLGHRDDQLAVVLGLGVLAALELDPGQLGGPVHEPRDLVAELVADGLQVDVRVLDDVVEECRCDRLLVEVQLGQDLRHPERVVDELLARPPLLTFMGVRSEREGAPQQVAVDLRLVGLDRVEQLIDKLLMTFGNLEDSHLHSVLRALRGKPSAPCRRSVRSDTESLSPCADDGREPSGSLACSSCCSSR